MALWSDSHKFTFLLLIAVTVSSSLRCDRLLTGVTVERTKLDNEFQVILTNLNRTDVYETYMPNTKYLSKFQSSFLIVFIFFFFHLNIFVKYFCCKILFLTFSFFSVYNVFFLFCPIILRDLKFDLFNESKTRN